MPLRPLFTRTTRCLPKRAPGPRVGAANVTVAFGTALPSTSVTLTASRIGKRAPTCADWPDAEPAAIAAGFPARLRSANCVDAPAVDAVTVNRPAVPFATGAGDAARPSASV